MSSGTRARASRSARALALALALVASGVDGSYAQQPDRTRPPQPGPPPSLKLPAIQKTALSNGLPVWLVEHHEVPLVQVNLIMRAGSAADPDGKFGAGALTAAMLDEGAGERGPLELADAIESLGAQLSTGSSWDQSALRLSVPVATLDAALSLMADVALRPSFPPDELERVRKERLAAFIQARDDPASIVALAFPRVVFGPAHRYGTSANGTEASLRSLTREDLLTFYRAHYRPHAATLVVVGDVTLAGVLPLLERAFGGWTPGEPGAAADTGKALASRGEGELVTDAPQLTRREVVLVDKPGAAQSQIRIGWVGVPRNTADYVTLEVLNTVLGGSFTSRLNSNLREKHGYSYGAFSTFDMRRSAGPFFASAGVQTDKTSEALREFFNELEGISKAVPADELEKAKSYVALGFPAEFETTGDLARKLEELIVFGLPDDTFTTFVDRVRQVDASAVQDAAARYIQPDKLAVVVVGDRQTIEAGIRALNLGPLRVLSVEEAVGAQ